MVLNNEQEEDEYATVPISEVQASLDALTVPYNIGHDDEKILQDVNTKTVDKDCDSFDSENNDDDDDDDNIQEHTFVTSDIGRDTKAVKHRGRYRQSIQVFKPYRKASGIPADNPIDDAGLLSLIYVTWLTSLFKKAIHTPLQITDLFLCSPFDSVKLNSERLERLWEEELRKKGAVDASFLHTVFLFLRTRFLIGLSCLSLCFSMGMVNSAFTIRGFIAYAADPDAPPKDGVFLCLLLGLMYFGAASFVSIGYTVNSRNGTRIRAAIIGLIYKKVLRAKTLSGSSIGQIINICTNDTMRFYEIAMYLSYPIIGPLVTIFGIVYLIDIIGPASLVGTSIMILFFIYQICSARIITTLRRRCLKTTDKRVRMINELIICIKLIKMYAWEIPFANVISGIRNKEKKELQKAGFLTSFNASASPLVCALASVSTFTVHIALGNNLTALQAFTCIAVTNSMRVLYLQTPRAVRCMADCAVAAQRIKKLLLIHDIQSETLEPDSSSNSIEIDNGTFGWNTTPTEEEQTTKDTEKDSLLNTHKDFTPVKSNEVINVLFDINLHVKKGELVGICGSVGSGKSSLLSSLLSQMETSSGSLATHGSFAYVAQEAMILNDTLRENILFGNEFDQLKYDSVIFNSCLSQDISMLPFGDETEIGERGINLSGGQKQRVSLARALYANRDIYLLDDPLSAVDVHVGQHIFTNSIKEFLQDNTVLFVTHQLQYLKQCDKVIMFKDGMIIETGTFHELVDARKEFSALINKYYSELSEKETNVDKETETELERVHHLDLEDSMSVRSRSTELVSALSVDGLSSVDEVTSNRALTKNELNEAGSVKLETFVTYIQAAGGYVICLLTILSFCVMIGSIMFSQWWLSKWLEQGGGNTTIMVGNKSEPSTDIRDNPGLEFYKLVYLLTTIVMFVSSVLKSLLYVRATLVASSSLHDSVFRKVFHSPMSFFDTTPSGQIMNRFSKDLDEVDVQLPITMETFFIYLFSVLFALITVSIVFPMYLIGVAISFISFGLMGRIFRRCLRDIKRLENISRSPFLSHLTATIQGVQTMRAYSKETYFNKRFEELVDINSVALLLFELSNRWIAVRFDQLVMFMSVSVGAFAIMSHGQVSAAMVGLAITYSSYLLGTFQFSIRLGIESEARFTSAERLVNYIKNLETEGKHPEVSAAAKHVVGWPTRGEIAFTDIKMRYRQCLPLVLNGISFSIKANEKIGIVGRTGSGKSSLAICLYRLVERSSGCITIDGIDINTLDLNYLRSRLAIIPQDPVLFVGSIRYNLDPFNQFHDDEIWNALEKTYMKNKISALDYQLMAQVRESGDNFSLGERQLICMARALLRKSKILILDEATAAIDTETDYLIQTTIRQSFKDCTMLTIAHRLHTVQHCDRVMVLDNGNIVEFDTPSVLLSNPESKFAKMTITADE